ncbi:MAG: nucleoside hydrolase [Ruminococcus sp.]|nr:nucleoside hydrolase [Ruminococcus sp.]
MKKIFAAIAVLSVMLTACGNTSQDNSEENIPTVTEAEQTEDITESVEETENLTETEDIQEVTENIPKNIDPLANLSEKKRVIIDTDTGGDDAMALMLAAKNPNMTIEGVTVAAGNVDLEQASLNALASLEAAGSDAPVYKGADSSFAGEKRETFSVYGTDGMGDCDLIHPQGICQEMPAVDFILETVKNNPDEIEIVALGPVTNIALAIQQDPETMSHVKKIWSMGSAGLGAGNATPVSEFNVYKDAEAYDIMLKSGIDITIVGLDLCEQEEVIFSEQQLKDMKNGTPVQQFASDAMSKLLSFRLETQGNNDVIICDALAMAHVIWSDISAETMTCSASCVTDDCEAYGEVIFYRSDMVYDSMPELGEPNVTLVTKQNVADIYERINALYAT